MKKLVLSAAVAVLGLVGVDAQISMESVEVGARAGYNYSTLLGDQADDLDIKGKSGYHIDLFAEVPISERFSVQPEVSYSAQGAKLKLITGEATLKTQNINIPVLAKVYIADGFNVQAGPQLGINTGSKLEYDGSLVNTSGELGDDALSTVNFGLVFGAGYKMAEGVTIDARYNLGLTNAFNEDILAMDKARNGVFQIGVGYQF